MSSIDGAPAAGVRVLGGPPPAGVLLFRGERLWHGETGLLNYEKLEKSARRGERVARDKGTWDGIYRLSVVGDHRVDDETDAEVAIRVFEGTAGVAPRQAHLADLGKLVQAFKVVATPPDPYHYDVELGAVLSNPVLDAFAACFHEDPNALRVVTM